MRVRAVALAAVLLAACGGDGGEGRIGDAAPGTLELTPETTTTMPEDTSMADLLIEDAPEGYVQADAAMGAGPLDLEGAAAAEVDHAAERALLETRGFQRGWSRAWLTPDDDVVYVAAYELGSDEAAARYLEDGTETLLARGAEPFDVPGVDGARGYVTLDESEAGTFTAYAVAFTRGPHWFLVLNGSAGSGASPDVARALAEVQARRVEGP